MTKHNLYERPRSRVKKSSRAFRYGLVFAILSISMAGYLYWPQIIPRLTEFRRFYETFAGGTNVSAPPSAGTQAESTSHSFQPAVEKTPPPLTTGENPSPPITVAEGKVADEESPGGTTSENSNLLPASVDPKQLVDELNIFYAHLDQEPYMQDFGLKEPSKVHFSKLLQKLIDNPPVVIRETDDLLILLKNTAHFYRILDKDNITILKGILDRDRKSFEQILKTFYALTYYPEYLQKEYSLTLPIDALQNYAAFFLNTIGGKLYLFRRDSASRMTVSYYAILIIDRANREGNNQLGIDLKPAIDSLIEEIENTGKNLKFRNEYLENLYDLKEKYN